MKIQIDIGIGEAVDRASILQIKIDLLGLAKYRRVWMLTGRRVDKAYNSLTSKDQKLCFERLNITIRLVNEKLWKAEDAIRKPGLTDAERGVIAMDICKLNDRRTKLKREIDELFGEESLEVKVYT